MTAEFGIYVHLPWCVQKCPYCDFNSHELQGPSLPEQAYVEALCRDAEAFAVRAANRKVASIFLGGGTPSLFSPAAVATLLDHLARHFCFSDDIEITLEANPGRAELGDLAGYRGAGVNRLSLGVQSFDPRALQALGRIHDPREAVRAVDGIHAAGFGRWNIDLMYGLPGQSVVSALLDVQRALALGAQHVSHYQLTIEPNTVFAKRVPALPPETVIEAIEARSGEMFSRYGLQRYEVSAWAIKGEEARHNLCYWRYGDYLGLGAGAHGKWTSRVVVRSVARRSPAAYLRDPSYRDERVVEGPERAFEFALNRFRLFEPIATGEFPGFEQAAPTLMARERGLLRSSIDGIEPTDRGRRYLNELTALYLPDA